MININTNSIHTSTRPELTTRFTEAKRAGNDSGFAAKINKLGQILDNVDGLQKTADASIVDLLAGKTSDVTSVVAAVAKADMGFKLLVGVRNKLIEAYKQTMNMPL